MPTTTLRRRTPIFYTDDAGDDDQTILDEQEQDELIQRLKSRANAVNVQYILAARLLTSLSIIL
ncbi:hypothetical protein AX15_002679 [Amanita polypyramis BW_CC]|nr:hypothetical protein AX15_002679 [Amanita polypyramis BW_CC]